MKGHIYRLIIRVSGQHLTIEILASIEILKPTGVLST